MQIDKQTFIKSIIQELKTDLSVRDFELELTEDSLYYLEKHLTKEFQEGIINKEYLIRFSLHLTFYIGEVFINTYGGSWVLVGVLDENIYYPKRIVCSNNRFASSFLPMINDILNEEIEYTKLVTLSAPYSNIKIDCKCKI